MKTPEEMAEEYAFVDIDVEASYVCEERKHAFLAGYQAAKDQLADADKVMDTCEHILDMEKMVDVNSLNNLNGWISVKEQLPRPGQEVLVLDDKIMSVKAVSDHGKWHPYNNGCPCYPSHWQPLPEPPKEEKE